jgi:hypothetical protein
MALRKIRHIMIAAVALVVIGGGVGALSRSTSAVRGQGPGDGSKASLSDNASGFEEDSKASAEPEAKVKENLKDRREMLLKAIEARKQQWQAGATSLDPLKDDLRALVKVALELSADLKGRVDGLKECEKLTREVVDVTEAKLKAGKVSEADGLEVKVLLLEIQAELLREQNKLAHAVEPPPLKKDKLTVENTKKIKALTTTYKEVVELLGEPANKNTDKDGKVRSAKWISGVKSFTVIFENEVVKSTTALLIAVPENPKLTEENVSKIKAGTTTFKEVVELLGEPTTMAVTKEGKLKNAIYISGSKMANIDFEDNVVQYFDATFKKVAPAEPQPDMKPAPK